MADNGSFNAQIELTLVNCGSVPGFKETVAFNELNGSVTFTKPILAGGATVCFDVAKACSQDPKLLVLRPMSVQFDVLTKENGSWTNPDDHSLGPWIGLDQPDVVFTRDQLALWLTFKIAPSETALALGRPQFYFDAMKSLLLAPSSTPPTTLTFSLVAPSFDGNGKVTQAQAQIKKKLFAVTVQLIAAYS